MPMEKQHAVLPGGEAVKLGRMVEYAAGSIVSKTILKEEKGTLTLFAFDEGQALSEHTAPFNAVVQVLDGRAILMIGGREIQASAGETVLMPANVPHALMAPQRFKMLLIMIRK